jgi:hypothetical protein
MQFRVRTGPDDIKSFHGSYKIEDNGVPSEDDNEFAAAFEKATPDGPVPDYLGPDGLLASDTG